MKELTNKNYDEVMKSEKPVIIEFYGEKCDACKEIMPLLESINQKCNNKFDLYKCNIYSEETKGIASKYKIRAASEIAIVYKGEVIGTFAGAKYSFGDNKINAKAYNEDALKENIEKYLNKIFSFNNPTQCKKTENLEQKVESKNETSLNLSDNALIILKKRYLKKDETGKAIETPEDMFKRVALAIAEGDKNYGASKKDIESLSADFYDMMAELKFLPNSPTLMNAGRDLGQLSACFVLPVGDSIEEICAAAGYTAIIQKSGGGTGFSFSRLRPKDDMVRSTAGVSSGPIVFMYLFNIYTDVIKQGGTRRGANMGIMRVDHPNILDFIDAKRVADEKNSEIVKKNIEKVREVFDRYKLIKYAIPEIYNELDWLKEKFEKTLIEKYQLNNFNISVALTDEFIEKVKRNEKYNLINPKDGKIWGQLNAREVFNKIVNSAWKNGEPGVIFIDSINKYNPTPHIGEIEATNPCGEQPLLPYESCNLGSINLAKFLKKENGKKVIDWNGLEKIVCTAVHFLDNVIDINKYPLPQIEEKTKANRKIGLGVMGFADMLIELGISYNSQEAISIGEEVMKFIREKARAKSVELGEKRGVFKNFEGSIYDKNSKNYRGEDLRLRNATLTTIAPTGTLSMIANCSSGIEPIFEIIYKKKVLEGKELKYMRKDLECMLLEKGFDKRIIERIEKEGLQNIPEIDDNIKKLFVSSLDIPVEQHIAMQAAFQKYTDNAVSKTINLPFSATISDVEKAYFYAYEKGCKGLTVYRDKSRDEQVINITRETKALDERNEIEEEIKKREKRPKILLGLTRKERVGDGKSIYVTKNFREDSELDGIIKYLVENKDPIEIFINSDFFDPDLHGAMIYIGKNLSIKLRKGQTTIEKEIEILDGLPIGKELGYDEGFNGKGYVNKSLYDALRKVLMDQGMKVTTSFVMPIKNTEKKVNDNEENVKKRNELVDLCPKCGKGKMIAKEGCIKCDNEECNYSPKGCE
ncbi:MAG: adenosylcobalamin-dependent ribonucleoside-diphosphate reductase [Candidatus Pacearchaeota archaeon]